MRLRYQIKIKRHVLTGTRCSREECAEQGRTRNGGAVLPPSRSYISTKNSKEFHVSSEFAKIKISTGFLGFSRKNFHVFFPFRKYFHSFTLSEKFPRKFPRFPIDVFFSKITWNLWKLRGKCGNPYEFHILGKSTNSIFSRLSKKFFKNGTKRGNLYVRGNNVGGEEESRGCETILRILIKLL